MANNRMFLVYRPTGEAVLLGKRMACGWYGTPENVAERIMALFAKAEAAYSTGGHSQDDFAIALEVGKNQPHAIHVWAYTGEGDKLVGRLEIDKSVPYGKPETI